MQPSMLRRFLALPLFLLLLLLLFSANAFAQAPGICGTDSGEGCADASARVDRYEPIFSHPTAITNPFFPMRALSMTLLLGHVDGQPFHVEYRLMPQPRTIRLAGKEVQAVELQYLAHHNGLIAEVALDWYAQDDRGAVWYLGEDVSNYKDGMLANREGTWMAGKDGPAAMIMPAHPQEGDVYRAENIPGLVFEEVTVAATGVTVQDASSTPTAAIIVSELNKNGDLARKTFAAGYGEFVTMDHDELEAVALAVPRDAGTAGLPPTLGILTDGAASLTAAAQDGDWETAGNTVAGMTAAWRTYQVDQENGVPLLLAVQMETALVEVRAAVDVRQPLEVGRAANNAMLAALDLRLRHEPLVANEQARLHAWVQRLQADSAADDITALRSDIVTLEWMLKRMAHTLDKSTSAGIKEAIDQLHAAAEHEDGAAIDEAAAQLSALLE